MPSSASEAVSAALKTGIIAGAAVVGLALVGAAAIAHALTEKTQPEKQDGNDKS